MTPRTSRLLALATLGLAVWLFHPHGTRACDPDGDAREHDCPTLYTNADLERFGPPSPPPAAAPAAVREDEAWAFVEGFLERQSMRLQADRRYELELRELEVLRRQCEEDEGRARFVAPFLGIHGTSFLAPNFRFSRRHGPKAAPSPPRDPSPHGRPFDPRSFMNQRPTIHAQPPARSR